MKLDDTLSNKYNELTKTLIEDLHPVEPRKGDLQLLTRAVFLFSVVISSLAFLGLFRDDMSQALDRADFLVETTTLVLAFFAGILATLWLTYPGGERKGHYATYFFFILVTFWAFFIVKRALIGDWSADEVKIFGGLKCQGSLLVYSVVSLVLVSVPLLIKSAPVKLKLLAVMVLASSLTAAALVLQFLCPIDHGPHTFFSHFLPIPFIVLFGSPLFIQRARW